MSRGRDRADALNYPTVLEFPMQDRVIPALLQARAAEQADDIYLVYGDDRYTFGETAGSVAALTQGLRRAGVSAGEHVAVIMQNGPEMLFTLFALASCGAVALPVNPEAKGAMLTHYLADFDAVVAIVEDLAMPNVGEVRGDCPALRTVVHRRRSSTASEVARGDVDFATLYEPGPAIPEAEVRFTDIAMLTFTSGTSGPSKGVIATHASLLSSALAYAQAFSYASDDRLYVCLPLFHSNAYSACCLAALVAGASVALADRFSASEFWNDVRRYRVTRLTALGSVMNILWSRPPSVEDGSHSVRTCFAVPLPEYASDFEQRFGLKLITCYGLTDYCVTAFLRADHPTEKARSSGQIRPEVEVRIVDPDDLELPAGAVGEICVRTLEPWIAAQGYYNMPADTLASQRNQWFHSGDRGHLDADGYLYFDGRASDKIRRSGENVSAFDVEQIIATHPDVADVAAYSVPSDRGEDEIMVSVVLRPGAALSEDELAAFCTDTMARFMVPRFIEFRLTLPRTATQKVLKRELQEQAGEQQGKRWDRLETRNSS